MSLLEAFAYIEHYPADFIFAMVLALIPSAVWMMVFYKKHKEKKAVLIYSFIAGMFSAVLVLTYQYYWGEEFNLGFFAVQALNFQENIQTHFSHPIISSLLICLSIGFMEEYTKHWVTKKADHQYFRSIDDVIELSIVVALGFAFLENIGYFFRQIIITGNRNILGIFVIRSALVVFIHILCSGIYGYFYGLGYFSTPVYKDENKIGKKFFIPTFLHTIFHFRRSRVFHDEMISLGLIVSVSIHGLYDFVLDTEISFGDILGISIFDGIKLYYIVLPMIFSIGFYTLNSLIANREDQKVFGQKLEVEEFCKL